MGRRELRVQYERGGPSLAVERLFRLGVDDVHRLEQAAAHAHVCADRGAAVRVPAERVVLHVVRPPPAAAAWIENGAERDQIGLLADLGRVARVVGHPDLFRRGHAGHVPRVVLEHAGREWFAARVLLDALEKVEVVADVAHVHFPVVDIVVLLVVEPELLQRHETSAVRGLRNHVVDKLAGQTRVQHLELLLRPELDEAPKLARHARCQHAVAVPLGREHAQIRVLDLDEDAHVVRRLGVVQRQLADHRAQVQYVVFAPRIALVRPHHNRRALHGRVRQVLLRRRRPVRRAALRIAGVHQRAPVGREGLVGAPRIRMHQARSQQLFVLFHRHVLRVRQAVQGVVPQALACLAHIGPQLLAHGPRIVGVLVERGLRARQ